MHPIKVRLRLMIPKSKTKTMHRPTRVCEDRLVSKEEKWTGKSPTQPYRKTKGKQTIGIVGYGFWDFFLYHGYG